MEIDVVARIAQTYFTEPKSLIEAAGGEGVLEFLLLCNFGVDVIATSLRRKILYVDTLLADPTSSTLLVLRSKICFRSLDVSEIFVSGVFSMH